MAQLREPLSKTTVAITLGIVAVALVAAATAYFFAPVPSTASRYPPGGPGAKISGNGAMVQMRARGELPGRSRRKPNQPQAHGEKPAANGAATGSPKTDAGKPASDIGTGKAAGQ